MRLIFNSNFDIQAHKMPFIMYKRLTENYNIHRIWLGCTQMNSYKYHQYRILLTQHWLGIIDEHNLSYLPRVLRGMRMKSRKYHPEIYDPLFEPLMTTNFSTAPTKKIDSQELSLPYSDEV